MTRWTGQLRSTLQTPRRRPRAREVDVDAVIGAGNRRLRRRRVALAGGTAVIALAVAAGATTLGIRVPTTRPSPPPTTRRIPPAYAVGSVIHTGDSQIDVGVPIRSMVVLDDGFVSSGPDQTGTLAGRRRSRTRHSRRRVDPPVRLRRRVNALWLDSQNRIDWWPGYFDRILTFHGHTVEAVSAGHLWWSDGPQTRIAELPPLTTHATWPDGGLGDQPSSRTPRAIASWSIVGGGLAVVRARLLPRPHDPGWADFQPGTDLSGVTPQVTGVSTGDLAPTARTGSPATTAGCVDDSTASDEDPDTPASIPRSPRSGSVTIPSPPWGTSTRTGRSGGGAAPPAGCRRSSARWRLPTPGPATTSCSRTASRPVAAREPLGDRERPVSLAGCKGAVDGVGRSVIEQGGPPPSTRFFRHGSWMSLTSSSAGPELTMPFPRLVLDPSADDSYAAVQVSFLC